MRNVKDKGKKKISIINDIPFERHHGSSNELGRIHVSISKQQIYPVETQCLGDAMAQNKKPNKENKDNTNNSGNVMHDDAQKEIDDIWKHLGLGHIDISYACVGYSMDGRAILNYNEFVNLLTSYGFNIDAILDFIEDFALHSANDNTSPIVMLTTNTSNIMANTKSIV